MQNSLWITMIFSFLLGGCNVNDYDDVMARVAGNKPNQYFHFSNPTDANHYTFHDKAFDIHMLQTKQSDWSHDRRWGGSFVWNGVVIYLHSFYHVLVTSSRKASKYDDEDRALEEGNINYIRKRIKIDADDKLYIKRYGKENYICTVMEYTKQNTPQKEYMGVECYKYNKEKTKVKNVHIRLTYSKPTNPTLARQYTYTDLKRRAKRMLDSLYIKEGW